MKERKLNYRFHNPNPAAVTADCILNIFIEANAGKVESAIQNAAAAIPVGSGKDGSRKEHPVCFDFH